MNNPFSSARFDAIDRKLNLILSKLGVINQEELSIMASVADLPALVANEKTVDASIIALLNGVVATLNDIKSKTNLSPADQATFDQAVADFTAQQSAIAAAVVANTPAAP